MELNNMFKKIRDKIVAEFCDEHSYISIFAVAIYGLGAGLFIAAGFLDDNNELVLGGALSFVVGINYIAMTRGFKYLPQHVLIIHAPDILKEDMFPKDEQ